MKKQSTKFVLYLLVFVFLFSACGTVDEAGDTSPSDSTPEESTDKVVQLSAVCVPGPLTKDFNELGYLNEMQEKAGVSITWEQISSGWGEKKSVMLGSGDLPDFFIGPAVSDSDFAQFPDLFAPLNDLIDSHAPNVKKMFEEKPELEYLSTQLNGDIYGLPKFQRYWPRSMPRQMINKEWLDTLGLEVPTNWDELYEVLVEFKNNDPNKNQVQDEIPMDWAPGIGGFGSVSMVAAFGLPISMYQGSGYFVQDGKVRNLFVLEEYKQLIEFLNKCYSEQLINPEVFTQDYADFQMLSRSPDAPRVGFTFGWDILDRMGPDWASQYITVGPLTPNGFTGQPVWEVSYYDINYASSYACVSQSSNNKEAAIRFIDLFYDSYYGMQALFGTIGECIQDNGDGTYKVLPPKDSSMDPGTWKWTNAMADNSPMYISKSLELELPEDMKLIAELDKVYDPHIDRIPESDYWPGVFFKYSEEDNIELANISNDIHGILVSKNADWISNGGIDAEWDDYVSKLKQGGLDRAIAIYQKYYDEYMNK